MCLCANKSSYKNKQTAAYLVAYALTKAVFRYYFPSFLEEMTDNTTTQHNNRTNPSKAALR